jgi:hypothetical protein
LPDQHTICVGGWQLCPKIDFSMQKHFQRPRPVSGVHGLDPARDHRRLHPVCPAAGAKDFISRRD